MKQWWESKTVWAGLGGIVISAGAYLSGEMALSEFLKLGFEAILAIFIRAGIGLGKRA